MTDQRPLSETWFHDMPQPDSDLWQQWMQRRSVHIAALEEEIERLKVWGSDSHVTDLETALAEERTMRKAIEQKAMSRSKLNKQLAKILNNARKALGIAYGPLTEKENAERIVTEIEKLKSNAEAAELERDEALRMAREELSVRLRTAHTNLDLRAKLKQLDDEVEQLSKDRYKEQQRAEAAERERDAERRLTTIAEALGFEDAEQVGPYGMVRITDEIARLRERRFFVAYCHDRHTDPELRLFLAIDEAQKWAWNYMKDHVTHLDALKEINDKHGYRIEYELESDHAFIVEIMPPEEG